MKLSLWDQKVSNLTTVLKLVIKRVIQGYKFIGITIEKLLFYGQSSAREYLPGQILGRS